MEEPPDGRASQPAMRFSASTAKAVATAADTSRLDARTRSTTRRPTTRPETTVSARLLPPRRLKPCMSQQDASPTANRPSMPYASPSLFTRMPPME